MGDDKLIQRDQMPRKWREKGGEEDREWEGKSNWTEWVENGEQQQKTGIGDC